MHQILTKHEKLCKQNNQLPTESRVELKDNSDVCKVNIIICEFVSSSVAMIICICLVVFLCDLITSWLKCGILCFTP
jgi:hypothetical protein